METIGFQQRTQKLVQKLLEVLLKSFHLNTQTLGFPDDCGKSFELSTFSSANSLKCLKDENTNDISGLGQGT